MALNTTSHPKACKSCTTVLGLHSKVVALYPLLCNASAMAAAVLLDTSASFDGPPMRTMIRLSFTLFFLQ